MSLQINLGILAIFSCDSGGRGLPLFARRKGCCMAEGGAKEQQDQILVRAPI